MNEWQPIETAPRDGTHILLFGDFLGEIYLHAPKSIGVGKYAYGSYILVHSDAYSVDIDPTHWMPLPSPPGDAA